MSSAGGFARSSSRTSKRHTRTNVSHSLEVGAVHEVAAVTRVVENAAYVRSW
jgi:hypothetical protein